MSLIERLLTRRATRSGSDDQIVGHVTGITPTMLDSAALAGVLPPGGILPPGGVGGDGAAGGDATGVTDLPVVGRRGRGLDRAETVLHDQVAQKILGYWLQNRHQVLFPLTVNFRSIEPAQRALLARWMAVALLAGHLAAGDHDRLAAREWLASVGADTDTLGMFALALDETPPLHAVLHAVQATPGLAAYAYVVALIALGQRELTSQFFLEYLAARLALPSNVVRSANRRYRR